MVRVRLRNNKQGGDEQKNSLNRDESTININELIKQ